MPISLHFSLVRQNSIGKLLHKRDVVSFDSLETGENPVSVYWY